MSLATPRKGYKSVKWWFGKTMEIPEEWEDCRIGDMVKFEGGSQPERINFRFQPTKGYVRMIQIRDFKTDHYQTYIPINSTKKFFKKDDIMIGRYGPPNFQILRGLEGAYNVALMKAIPTKTEKNYLYYFLKQKTIFNIIDSLAKRTAGQDGVELDVLRRLPFPLPPKEEQQKIASILSNIDNLIESTGKVITHSKKVKKGLMQKLLTRGIGHTKFKKVKIIPNFIDFTIPEEWEIIFLSELSVEIRDGPMGFSLHSSDYVESGVPLLRIKNLKKLKIIKKDLKFITKEKHDELQKSQVKPLDIIISKTGILGVLGVVPENYGEANLNQALARITLKEKQMVTYVSIFLSSKIPQQILNVLGSGRTVQTGLKLSDIKKLEIPVPPLPEQQKIVRIIENIDSKITSQEQYKEKLEKLKKSLMQKLLTGEVRV